jgi:predicted nucleic acid-binding protein
MKKVFLDTNILIDVVAKREGFYEVASNILNLGIEGQVILCVTPMSYATCAFVARKVLGYKGAIRVLQLLEKYLEFVPMTSAQCRSALYADMPDFEDMLQFESAYAAGCDVIITRNRKHFPQEAMQLLEPEEFFNCYWPQ